MYTESIYKKFQQRFLKSVKVTKARFECIFIVSPNNNSEKPICIIPLVKEELKGRYS